MSSGIIELIKQTALNAFKASKPVEVLFGEVISTDPVKIQVYEMLTLTQEFLIINGTVSVGDKVTLIQCQGGQRFVVLGTRTSYVENTVYNSGESTYVDDSGWQYPFKSGYVITSAFGVNRGGGKKHKGVDLVGAAKHIYPISGGTVITRSYDNGGYGNYVVVDHDNDYWSLYAHMKEVYVKVGQTVNKNTILGVEGSTGNSTGSHLHLEVRKGSNSSSNVINPIAFLDNN